jgi:hypothetical protein
MAQRCGHEALCIRSALVQEVGFIRLFCVGRIAAWFSAAAKTGIGNAQTCLPVGLTTDDRSSGVLELTVVHSMHFFNAT